MMKKEMSKSKKPAIDGTATPTSTGKKYLKRAEIEAERQAAYAAEQKALEATRVAKLAEKRKREEDAAVEDAYREEKRRKLAEESRIRREDQEWEEEEARRERLGLPPRVRKKDGEGEEQEDAGGEDIPEEELLVKLRGLGEPVVLFGESHIGRLKRYRRLTTVMTKGPVPTTLVLVDEKDMKVAATVPKDKAGREWLFRQLASYFTMVMTAYEKTMEAEKRDTTTSKNAYNAMVQTIENMKPVSKHCLQDLAKTQPNSQ